MSFIDDRLQDADDLNYDDVEGWEWAELTIVEYSNFDYTLADQALDLLEDDVNGYGRNWKIISRAIRDEREWTCERCHIPLGEKKERRFLLHVHHKDRNKKNNNESNLEALCVVCHSECEGHDHLKKDISHAIYSEINHLRNQQHAKYKSTNFDMQCDIRKIGEEKYGRIVQQHGARFLALMENRLYPLNEVDRRFIDVCFGRLEPMSEQEHAWLAYLLEVERSKAIIEKETRLKQLSEEKLEEEIDDDWCLGCSGDHHDNVESLLNRSTLWESEEKFEEGSDDDWTIGSSGHDKGKHKNEESLLVRATLWVGSGLASGLFFYLFI